jgi:hypothetical protein
VKNKQEVVRPDYGHGPADVVSETKEEEADKEVTEPVTKVEDDDEDDE